MSGQGPKEQEFRSPANAAQRRRPQKPWYSKERSPAHKRPARRREVQEQPGVRIDNALAFRRTSTLPVRFSFTTKSILPPNYDPRKPKTGQAKVPVPLVRPQLKQAKGLRKEKNEHHADTKNHRRY